MAGLNTHFKTILTLSWRNLWRNHRRTAIMLGAISVGVWAMIFMTALMRGMVDDMLNQGIRNLPGHIQIQHPDFLDDPSVVNSIDEPRGKLLTALTQNGSHSWASRIRVPAVIASERESRGINLIGIEPAADGSRYHRITGADFCGSVLRIEPGQRRYHRRQARRATRNPARQTRRYYEPGSG
jgi:ABC-type lipoprotein release transport system permease subunit